MTDLAAARATSPSGGKTVWCQWCDCFEDDPRCTCTSGALTNQPPTYSDRDLCKHAADFIRSRPELTWDEAMEKARKNFQECGYVPAFEATP